MLDLRIKLIDVNKMNSYRCASCNKIYEEIDPYYYHHVSECFGIHVLKLNNKILKMQQTIYQMKSEHTISYQQIQKSFDKKSETIKDTYDNAMTKIKEGHNPQIEFLKSQLDQQKQLYNEKFHNDIQVLRDEFVKQVDKNQALHNATISEMKFVFTEKEKKYKEENQYLLNENNRINNDIGRLNKNIENNKNTINNLKSNHIQQRQEDRKYHMDIINIQKKKIIELSTKVSDLLIANSKYNKRIIKHDEEVEVLQKCHRLEMDKLKETMIGRLHEYKSNKDKQLEQQQIDNDKLSEKLDIITNQYDNQYTELHNLEEKYKIALRNINDWEKKYNKLNPTVDRKSVHKRSRKR